MDPCYLFPKFRRKWEQVTPAVIRMSKHTSIAGTWVTLFICSLCCLLWSENLTAVTNRDLFFACGLMPDFVLNFHLLFSGAGRFILHLKGFLATVERFMLMTWCGVHLEVGRWQLLSALLWQGNSSYNLFVNQLTLVLIIRKQDQNMLVTVKNRVWQYSFQTSNPLTAVTSEFPQTGQFSVAVNWDLGKSFWERLSCLLKPVRAGKHW